MHSVLVVDDDLAIQRLLKAVLTSEGFAVRCVDDGVQALDAIDEAQPDLLILDLQMPVMDGRALLLELRRREQDFPVLIISAVDARAVGREFSLPAMQKPFDVDALAIEANRLIGATGTRAGSDTPPAEV